MEVRCRSGYRGEEYPESFLYKGEEHQIVEILRRFLEEDSETRERKRVFLVRTRDRSKYRLTRYEDGGRWQVDASGGLGFASGENGTVSSGCE